MGDMKPVEYFKSLAEDQKQAYAERVGTSLAYIRIHILATKGFRKRPGDNLIVSIVKASEGNVSLDEAIDYFLVQPVKTLAKESAGSTNSISNKITPPSNTLRGSESLARTQAALF